MEVSTLVALPVIMHDGRQNTHHLNTQEERHIGPYLSACATFRRPGSQHCPRFDRSDMMDPQSNSTLTSDTDYTEALESLVPPSQSDSRGQDVPVSAAPAGPGSDSQWREPTDQL